ncbi:MAG: hypothetical protein H0X41_04425, partial [Chitinophagaceae bacterium]|nr:hypothetical protein [Chitinophagaceae bacterium]
MKNTITAFAVILALAGCSDNNSSDDSQNNTSTTMPSSDSGAHSGDSSRPNVEDAGAQNPNTVNSGGNQSTGATTKDSVMHSNGVTDGSATSPDTAPMFKGQK